ncbi:MAG: ATP-binding protein [Pseudoxanthomonas sp.]
MSRRAGGTGLSIFNRTFLLLLAALAVAQGVAVALLIHAPIRSGAAELMEVVALLSSRIPSSNSGLRVYTTDSRPAPDPGKGFRSDETVRLWIARWLGVEPDAVVFVSTRMVRLRGGGPDRDGDVPPQAPAPAPVPAPASSLAAPPSPPIPEPAAAVVPEKAPLAVDPAPKAVAPAETPPAIVPLAIPPVEIEPPQIAPSPMPRPTFDAPANRRFNEPSNRDRAPNERRSDPGFPGARPPMNGPPGNPAPGGGGPPGGGAPPPGTRFFLVVVPPPPAFRPVLPASALMAVAAAARTRIADGSAQAPPPFDPGAGPPGFGDRPPPGGELAPDTLLRGDFIAAVRQPDGRWRVVESTERGLLARIGKQAGLLFLLGLAILLPLAWWFSRALSAPIREFARAADHLGRNPDAPRLPRQGPSEIALAADSFNTMQTRLNRMIAERTQMAGAIAHDLRTPLARLAFRLDRLPADEQQKAQADIEEMKSMIASALDFLRDQSRSGARERLDFRSLAESVVDGLADTGQDVTLEAGASATVVGDPIALRRVVANLADNALKYGQRARLRIHAEGDACLLQVDDDGPGIDPAQAELLFMPFYRGEASRNRNTGGTGLGLASVQGIVASHGGEVSLRNRPEGGLRVTVTLPVG